jgi:hypothetical protein
MPKFEMNGKTLPEFRALPYIVQGFIEAMFFTDGDSEEIPSDCGFADLHPDSLLQIIEFCEAFEKAAGTLIDEACDREGYDSERLGNDLWYTSQGHGVGFWDRTELDLQGAEKEEYERLTNIMVAAGHATPAWNEALAERNKLVSLGDKLANLCRYREAQVWFGDHVTYGDAPFVHVEIKF